MKHKNIFRMTSVLLISIICVCGLSLNAYASDGGEYYSTEPSEETTTPPVIVIPAESEDGEQTDEPIITRPENAFTPDGNMTLVDNVEGEDEGEKQFIIVQSKNGHYFYIVIDYSTEGENTVHFLNQVDEADLMALTETGEATKKPEVCNCTEKCEVGKVNTSCPVCATTLTGCTGKEPTPTPTEQPEEPKEKDGNPGAVLALVLFVLLGGGAAFYYFKFVKPKHNVKGSTDLEDFDFEDYDEDEPEADTGEVSKEEETEDEEV